MKDPKPSSWKDKVALLLKDRGINDIRSILDVVEKFAPLAEVVRAIMTDSDKVRDAASPTVFAESRDKNERLNKDLGAILNAYQSNCDLLEKLEVCNVPTERATIITALQSNNDAIGLAIVRQIPS